MSRTLVDTGFLVALYDKREPMHLKCLRTYQACLAELVTCEAVLSEACYLLRNVPGAIQGILRSVEEGILQIPFTLSDSASAVANLMEKYRDTPADFADACLIHLADELDTGDILTLDSDFKHYRWRRNRSFRMLIPLE
ncbi:MAG: PIN domain-containing protein [Terracidiphilus sp.]